MSDPKKYARDAHHSISGAYETLEATKSRNDVETKVTSDAYRGLAAAHETLAASYSPPPGATTDDAGTHSSGSLDYDPRKRAWESMSSGYDTIASHVADEGGDPTPFRSLAAESRLKIDPDEEEDDDLIHCIDEDVLLSLSQQAEAALSKESEKEKEPDALDEALSQLSEKISQSQRGSALSQEELQEEAEEALLDGFDEEDNEYKSALVKSDEDIQAAVKHFDDNGLWPKGKDGRKLKFIIGAPYDEVKDIREKKYDTSLFENKSVFVQRIVAKYNVSEVADGVKEAHRLIRRLDLIDYSEYLEIYVPSGMEFLVACMDFEDDFLRGELFIVGGLFFILLPMRYYAVHVCVFHLMRSHVLLK